MKKTNKKIISTLVLFLMIIQMGFTSMTFALEYKNEELNINIDNIDKEKIILYNKLLNDPEMQELQDEIRSFYGNDRIYRMKWSQTDDFLLGFWDAIDDIFNGAIEDAKALLDYQTYKTLMRFCKSIIKGEIKLKDFKRAIEGELEPVEYVFKNTLDVFDPNKKVSNEKVRTYAENLCKTIILIIDAKNTVKNLPSGFDDLIDNFKDATKKIDYNAKKPDVDLDFIEDNIVKKKKFEKDSNRINFIKKWTASELRDLPQAENSGIKKIIGDSDDAYEFFKYQVDQDSIREVKEGTFIGKDDDGVTFTYRAKSKSGPPTIDVNGIKGIRKIKFLEE